MQWLDLDQISRRDTKKLSHLVPDQVTTLPAASVDDALLRDVDRLRDRTTFSINADLQVGLKQFFSQRDISSSSSPYRLPLLLASGSGILSTQGLANVSTSPTASSISSLICASLLSSSPFQNSTSPTRSCNFTSTSVCSLSTRIFASWSFVIELVDNYDKYSSPLSRTWLPPEVVLPRVALILPWEIENGFPRQNRLLLYGKKYYYSLLKTSQIVSKQQWVADKNRLDTKLCRVYIRVPLC